MVKTPESYQFPWAPFQVFQVKLVPDAGTFSIIKSYETVGGEERTYEYQRSHYLGHKQRQEKFGKIYDAFNKPYYTSKLGGSFTRGRFTPDTFTVAIGVTNLRAKHDEVTLDNAAAKPSIDYELLFELLDVAGFSPLKVLHSNRTKIQNEIKNAVTKLIDSGRQLSKQSFVDALGAVAKRWTDRVKDYIVGGDKPNLKPKTVDYFRKMKKENDPTLYPKGDETALVETGQLLDAIDYDVFVDQSAEMKTYVSAVKKIEARMRKQEKMSLKQRKHIELLKENRQKMKEDASEKTVMDAIKQFEKSALSNDEQFVKSISQAFEKIAIGMRRNITQVDALQHTVLKFRADLTAMIDIHGTNDVSKWPDYARDFIRTQKDTAVAAQLLLKKLGYPEIPYKRGDK